MGARITLSMDKDWSFHLGDIKLPRAISHGDVYGASKAGACRGVPRSDFDARDWEIVQLPHDWSIRQPFDEKEPGNWGYKPGGRAWYRKCFMLPEEYEGKELAITFDGVATNSTVYFNGSVLMRNYTGYAPFTVDITDRAHYGSTPNILAVLVDADAFEGWWYEGAGIYRHVWLRAKAKVNIAEHGVFVKPEKIREGLWNVTIQTTVCNRTDRDVAIELVTRLCSPDGGMEIEINLEELVSDANDENIFEYQFEVDRPQLWDIDSPRVYKVITELRIQGKVVDEDETVCGFRTIGFDADKGFFLNGRQVKLFGTCNHQDHGGIGVAVPDSIHEYRIERLKEMGSNAYRAAHGMPHPELLDACDRLGMLVMDENRNFETSKDVLEQLRKMVLRDRNHPCVIMYSLFNEEPLQATKEGRKMALHMKQVIRELDDSRFVTGAMHGGVLDDDSAASVVDVCGINYQINDYDAFHEKYPDMPVIGSETTSSFSVRGCYKTDTAKNEIAGYDEEAAGWGNTVRETWESALKREYVAGCFMWTGFDYLGEPTPHVWPSVSSFFGMMDTCGFAKDAFYLAKAIFSKEYVCHVSPHWNWDGMEGNLIRVMSQTNCEEAELFVNRTSYGRRKIDVTRQEIWEVPYEPGVLELIGYKDGMKIAHDVKITTGRAERLQIVPWRTRMYNDGTDAIPFHIVAVDANGREVMNASFPVEISVSGGEILGCANGNPNCHEPFDSNKRSIFNGRCQAIVRALEGEESLYVSASAEGMSISTICIPLVARKGRAYVPSVTEQYLTDWKMTGTVTGERPDPVQPVEAFDMNTWQPVNVEAGAPAIFDSQQGKYGMYRIHTVVPGRINGNLPTLHFQGLWGDCQVYINGVLRRECHHEWAEALDVPLQPEETGEAEIRVLVRSCNTGAGITSFVTVR